MKHFLRNMWLAMAGTLVLSGCITDENDGDGGSCGTGCENTEGFYVVNQGNTGYQIVGSLDWVNLANDSITSGIFKKANNQALGESPQNAVICGSKMYIAEFSSNRIWVVSANTAVLQGQVALTQPNKVYTDGTYVYATSNTGTVARIDTTSFQATEIPVGPNPVGMVVANGYLYVANSDGYNYQNNYENGKSVSKIALSSFQEVKKIPVGMNPTGLVADSQGNVFVACTGDYGATPPMIQKITPNDEVSDFTSASMMAVDGEKLYLIKQAYDANWNSTYDYFTMNSLTGDTLTSASSPMLRSNLPDNPTGIFIEPQSHDIFITSDAATPTDGSSSQYALKGSVMQYCPKGYFQKRYNVNVHPVCIVFKQK